MTDLLIEETYQLISDYHKKYLSEFNVKLPRLKTGKNYNKGALVLVYLAQGYPDTKIVTKDELTEFIRKYYPATNDVQQARHLAAQNGWFILSGTRKDNISIDIKPGEYKLKTLTEYYPNFSNLRRTFTEGADFFEELKKQYDYRCATCGSKENEPHRYWKTTTTVLQMGHMNPSKPLEDGNIIPQCEKCNRPDRNYWIYDKKGRVTSIANAKVVDTCSEKLQKEIYQRLKWKFEKKA